MMRTFIRAGALAAAVAVAACGAETGGGRPDGPVPVAVVNPEIREVQLWDEYIGRFEAVERVEIRPRVSGFLEEVHFEDGLEVEAGQLLFTIDQRPFEAALAAAEADRDAAEAVARFAAQELARSERLLDGPAGNREVYDRRLQEKSSADAALEAAEAAVKTAALDLDFSTIESPLAGRVGRDLINRGNLVTAGDSLLTTVVTTDPIYFVFTGSEQDYLRYLRLAQDGDRESSRYAPNPVRIRLEDQDAFEIEGVMDFVDNEIDQSTGSITGRAVVENDDGFLTPGMFGRMRLYGRDPYEAILVPDAAVQFDQSRQFVWVVDGEGKAAMRFVRLGRVLEDGMRIVEEGLSSDDRVIVGGVMGVRPGAPVDARPADGGGPGVGDQSASGE